MRQRFLTIMLLASVASALLFVLNQTSANPNHERNGFNRTFLGNALQPTDTATFENQFRSICGHDSMAIYFESEIPGNILKTSHDFKNPDTIQLKLPYIKNIIPMFTTVVRYPKIYIAAGNAKVLIEGNLLKDTFRVFSTGFQFRRGFFYNPNKAIMEKFGDSMRSCFIIFDLDSGKQVKEESFFGAGSYTGFTHDGICDYDQSSGSFLFLTYYANQAYRIDTNLTLIYKAHTIDTNRSSTVHVVQRGSHIKQSSTPTFVNNTFTESGDIIFTISNLKADNQPENSGVVMDLYVKKGFAYQGSMFIPRYDNEKLKSIKIIDNNLYALYSKHIVRYTLDQTIFKDLLQ